MIIIIPGEGLIFFCGLVAVGVDMSLALFYHPNSAPCRVVWCFLLENQIQCKLELVNLFQKEQFDEAYTAINPAHSVPTLVDNRFPLYERLDKVLYVLFVYMFPRMGIN